MGQEDDYAEPGLPPSSGSPPDFGDLLTEVMAYGFIGLLGVVVVGLPTIAVVLAVLADF